MSAPTFSDTEFNNLELVRQIVFQRLKAGEWSHFDYDWDERHTEKYVNFSDSGSQRRFVVLANEVLWQLIIQGIITPGMDSSNPALPWFRITDHGREVLSTERFVPHDPTGYLNDIRAVSKTTIGRATEAYLEEALRCYTSGCNVAATLLLGVAAEAVMLEICSIAREFSGNAAQKDYDNRRGIKSKHAWLIKQYEALSSAERKGLPESLDITLNALYDLIRRQRNELGHPQQSPPNVNREQAFIWFRMFPSYIEGAEAFAEYWKSNSP